MIIKIYEKPDSKGSLIATRQCPFDYPHKVGSSECIRCINFKSIYQSGKVDCAMNSPQYEQGKLF